MIAKPAVMKRERMPAERHGVTHRFVIGELKGYITANVYPDGRLGEVFITIAKEGTELSGFARAMATACSVALQYGLPLEALADKFIATRFGDTGFSPNPEIRNPTSVLDYIFRWLKSFEQRLVRVEP